MAPDQRIPARIGVLFFKYDDPAVDVVSESRTTEQETIDDSIVVQQLGSRADQITLTAVVSEYETPVIHMLPELGILSLRTNTWSGDVIVNDTNTSYRREYDADGAWLYDATITCTEVSKLSGPAKPTTSGGHRYGQHPLDVYSPEVADKQPDYEYGEYPLDVN